VLADARNHVSSADGARLAGAEAADYGAGDVEQLEWELEQAAGRPALIVTDGVFGATGEAAPLVEIVELARRHDAQVVVDETHSLGTVGPGGGGAAAAAGVQDDVDVTVGSLETSLGSYGGFACCDRDLARYLSSASHTLLASTAPAPPVVAAAMAALVLLRTEPRRVERLQRNASILREALAGHGVPALPGETPIVSVPLGPGADPAGLAKRLLERGLFVSGEATGPHGPALRLAVMATHTKGELRQTAEVVGTVVPDSVRRAAAHRVARRAPSAGGVFDGLADAA
jgi:7-keto-8-aminopelargonate synthetase-like enzyme